MKVIMEGIHGAEGNREKLINISESLDNDFVSGVKKAEFKKRRDSGSQYDFQSKHIEATKWRMKTRCQEMRWNNWVTHNQKEKTWIILLNVFIFADDLLALVFSEYIKL